MMKSVAIFSLLCGGVVVAIASSASAQAPGGYLGGPNAYASNPYSTPPVSPYINLGFNPDNGLSNYQSLVRPLIDDREAIARQNANLQQLQRQVRQGRGPASKEQRQGDANARPGATHFMYYSHYFGGAK